MPAFVTDGPNIPEHLLQAHEDGHVVFFCGAGISTQAGLPLFEGLVYNQDTADWHALERARLEAVGKIPPFIDGQIAAIAYVNELIRVASNPTDFRAFKEVQIRNWS